MACDVVDDVAQKHPESPLFLFKAMEGIDEWPDPPLPSVVWALAYCSFSPLFQEGRSLVDAHIPHTRSFPISSYQ